MKNEELYIKSRMGEHNPFRVPEGYFDNLTAEIMQQLPEQPKQGLMVRIRPWLYAAACLLAAVFTTTAYFLKTDTVGQKVAATTTLTASDSYIDEAADYVMADNIEIYACLSSEY